MSTVALTDNFRLNLRTHMTLNGMSSAELARRSGLHPVTISRILHGHLEPTVVTCEKLAIAAGMRADTSFLEPEKNSVSG